MPVIKGVIKKKEIDGDITDEEWENLHLPFNNNLDKYVTKYIIPEIFAFQLANSYFRGCLIKSSLLLHYNSMTDIILVDPSLEEVKADTLNLLQIKYNLTIKEEEPVLILETWQ